MLTVVIVGQHDTARNADPHGLHVLGIDAPAPTRFRFAGQRVAAVRKPLADVRQAVRG
jgi:hypothetical protein